MSQSVVLIQSSAPTKCLVQVVSMARLLELPPLLEVSARFTRAAHDREVLEG